MMWFFFFFNQKTAYEMRISDWSSDVCSSDLAGQRKQPRAIIIVVRQTAMLAPDVGGPVIGEGVFPPHAPRDLLDDPPVGHRLARQREERALAADRAVRIGYGAVLLAPCGGGQADVREGAGVGIFDHVADDDEGAGGRSEEHTYELQSLMRISYAVFCLKKKTTKQKTSIQ